MKTVSKPCNKQIKAPCGKISKYHKGISLPEAGFSKHNSDAFNILCKSISRSMIVYHDNYFRALVKPVDAKKSSCIKKKGILSNLPGFEHDICSKATNKSTNCNKAVSADILPASGHGICTYLVRNGMADLQIQAIMKLDGRLDFDKLKRAVRLSVDAEPVLGCRFVENERPYWKRLDNIDEITFCSMVETDDTDEAVTMFLQSPLDIDNAPGLKVDIIRSQQYDILGVKVNHAYCDETGIKEYIQLLSDIYSSIDQEAGTFMTEPRIAVREDQDRLIDELDTTCPELRWNPLLGTPKTMWLFPGTRIQRGEDSISFAVCRLPQGGLERVCQYGKLRGITVDDLILTAFYRAMFKTSKSIIGVPMDISSTIDLRPYLPDNKPQSMMNLSGGFITRIASMMNESFNGTLYRVARAKTGFAFSHNYFELISQTSEIAAQYPAYIRYVCFPGLSNSGDISDSLIRFGKNAATDAYIVPPVIRAPGFMLLTSSYNGILTLSIGYHKASVSQRDMEGLLGKIRNELMISCC